MLIDRKIAPKFHKINSINLQEPRREVLSGGVPLYMLNAGKSPVVRLEVVLQAGNWQQSTPGQAYFTAKMLTEGTAAYSAAEISEMIETLGAQIDVTPGLDFATISVYALTKHLNKLLPVLESMLKTAQFPEKELTRLKAIKIRQISINESKNHVIASQVFRDKLFGSEHPYGSYLQQEQVDQLSREDLISFYENRYNAVHSIYLSGAFTDSEITAVKQLFNEYTPSMPANAHKAFNTAPISSTWIDRPDSLQASLRLGTTTIGKNHPEFPAFLVLNEIFGGYFGSRLMKNIREEKGYTYGIHSAIGALKHGSYWIIGADIQRDFANETIEEVRKEILKLHMHAVEEEELETVKNYMIGAFLADINTPFAISDKAKMVHLHGLDHSYYQRWINTVQSITAEQIQSLAIRYFNPDALSEVIVGTDK